MKKINLVIFFLSIIISLIIYKITPKKELIVLITDLDYKNIKDNNYEKFIYNNITYKELSNLIDTNDYKIIKNKKIYLNQSISKSSKIIININNKEYNKKCNNKNINIEYYNERINKDKINLIKKLKKITSSKIIIIDNNCKIDKKINKQLDFSIETMYNTL